MADLLQPTGYYSYADNCPHFYSNEDEEPGDGIHVTDDQEGYLICLQTPIQPPADTAPISLGFQQTTGIIRPTGLKCDTCGTIVDMLYGSDIWMQKHIMDHIKKS